MKFRSIEGVVTAALLAFSMVAAAEDIDLFMNPTPDTVPKPNVLFIVDNTANWEQAFTNEMAALAETFAALPDGAFRIGIMFAAETGKEDNNVAGGYVRAALRLMDSGNKTVYGNLIKSLDKGDDKGNGGQASLVMAEAYRYLSGGVPYAGNNKGKADYTGNTYGTEASKAVYALPDNALASKSATQYNNPNSGCQKNFIIYISNGPSNDNTSVITQSTSMLAAAASALSITGATTPIPLSPSGSQDNVSDEWARFMKKTALGVTTFTIDVDRTTTGQGPGWTAVLKSMATNSKGKYFDVSSAGSGDAIRDALNSILSEIQSVNSVFAAVSLPVSVNTQGTYLNQVYVGMFRPDGNARPRWAGNLKQYKLGYTSSGKLGLLDADNKDAISSGGTGFISECARSYWTPSAVDTYWSFQPQGACLTVANSAASNYPDGNIVEKGAQAHKLRGHTFSAQRNVLTCTPGCAGLGSFLDEANVSQTSLGASTWQEFNYLRYWAYGLDLPKPDPNPLNLDWDENQNGISWNWNEMRPSVHGDVVHSRPVAINYGTDASPQVVVYYGGNDGLLRAVNGNRDGGAAIGGKGPGVELWSFMAPEFFPYIKRNRENRVSISFPDSLDGLTPNPEPKRYGFDGAITAHKNASNAWIYPTMRRGGRALYAFDVTSPASPTLKWKRGCPKNFSDDPADTPDDAGCNSGFEGIGQTWSAPKMMRAAGYGAGAKPMLIMGGGYDICEDGDPNKCGVVRDTKGNQIYVLDADTGALLKTFTTDRGVVADVFVVPDTTTGMAKYAYAADLGGNVYRISGADANTPFETTAPSEWKITKLASLGCDAPNASCSNRKFMFMPDIVEDNGKYVLLLGSGDREKPLDLYTDAASVSNYFFMLKDDPSDPEWLASESTTCGDELICLGSLYHIGANDSPPTLATVGEHKGWYLGLASKEQVVTSAITVFGTVTFSTHTPAVYDAEACTSNLGTACVYNITYANAAINNGTANRCEVVDGGGLPPSPVAGMVTLDGIDSDGDGDIDIPGQTVPFVIGNKSDSALQGGDPAPPPMAFQPKARVYWNIQP